MSGFFLNLYKPLDYEKSPVVIAFGLCFYCLQKG